MLRNRIMGTVQSGAWSLPMPLVRMARAVPNASWRSFRECLLEIEGKVLVVFLVSRRTVNAVDDVEVLRLNVDNYSWSSE
ncbi:hypothetical protein ACJRO7_027086 [Eucalyptus globulus]|uniref:Uncharacterized protein n=1 Tax=Eucalyptus globulus TaxID=34317 RepID=A0ABD3JSP4_EUCGL